MAVEIDAKKVESLAGQGLTTKQIADCIGCARSTFYEHKNKRPDISDALKRGRSKGIQAVTNALFESAVDGNTTAMIFYLKNRDPDKWKDRQAVDHTTKGKKMKAAPLPFDFNGKPETPAKN